MLNNKETDMKDHKPGDVFQINLKHIRQGWVGAFVLATEIKSWGIQGFVHHIDSHEKCSQAFIRLQWEHIDFIGHASLLPQGL